MNRKIIESYENVKLTRQITTGQFEVLFGNLNVSFDKYEDAVRTYRGICIEQKPTFLKQVDRLIRGKRAA